MEIQALTLRVSEKSLNDLAARHLPEDQPVEELRFRLTPEGLHITGEYPLFLKVAFETRWELGVRAGRVTARLASLKALGLPVAIFKSVLLKLVHEAAGHEDCLQLEDETFIFDVDRWLAAEGIPLRTNLMAIRCQEQSLIVLAGNGRHEPEPPPANAHQNSR
jgi:hypothetical protein